MGMRLGRFSIPQQSIILRAALFHEEAKRPFLRRTSVHRNVKRQSPEIA